MNEEEQPLEIDRNLLQVAVQQEARRFPAQTPEEVQAPSSSGEGMPPMSFPNVGPRSELEPIESPTAPVHTPSPVSSPSVSNRTPDAVSAPTAPAHAPTTVSSPSVSSHTPDAVSAPSVSVHTPPQITIPQTAMHAAAQLAGVAGMGTQAASIPPIEFPEASPPQDMGDPAAKVRANQQQPAYDPWPVKPPPFTPRAGGAADMPYGPWDAAGGRSAGAGGTSGVGITGGRSDELLQTIADKLDAILQKFPPAATYGK